MEAKPSRFQQLCRRMISRPVSIPLFEARSVLLPSLLMAAGLALIGCRGEKPVSQLLASPEVLAKVGELTITPEDLSEALTKRAKSLGGEAGPTLRQQVLDELIREKVLLNKARTAAVDRDPELVRRWERMVVAKYETAHKPDAEKQRAPTKTEVEDFYRDHAAEYQRPERIRVAFIQVKGSPKATGEKRAELRVRAEKIWALVQAPNADFAEITRLHSEDRGTRYSGGDVGWLERGQTPPSWPKELAEAVFSLETAGVIAPLVEAAGSFYILKLLERQAAGVRPLTEVRDRIVHRLKEQQRIANEERFYSEQRAGVTVEINQAALQAVPLPAPAMAKAPGAPPSLPSN